VHFISCISFAFTSLLGDPSKVFCLGAISSSITINFVIVSLQACKVLCMLLWMLSPLVFCVARDIHVCRSLES
jgi:hypothetical protein